MSRLNKHDKGGPRCGDCGHHLTPGLFPEIYMMVCSYCGASNDGELFQWSRDAPTIMEQALLDEPVDTGLLQPLFKPESVTDEDGGNEGVSCYVV